MVLFSSSQFAPTHAFKLGIDIGENDFGIFVVAYRPLPCSTVAVGDQQAKGSGVFISAHALFGAAGRFDLTSTQAVEQFHFEMVIAFTQCGHPFAVELRMIAAGFIGG
jgi:hypothetical protein